MFLRTVYEKIHAETSVQLRSDILVLLKCLAGRRGFNDVLYNFLCYKILKFNDKSVQICFYCKCFENESVRLTNRIVKLRTVDLTVCCRYEVLMVLFNWCCFSARSSKGGSRAGQK